MRGAGPAAGPGGELAARVARLDAGPLAAELVVYLSRRCDLFDVEDALSMAPPTPPEAPAEEIAARLERDLGSALDQVAGDLVVTPRRGEPLIQTHRAVLADGREARIRVVRPELVDLLEDGDELGRRLRRLVDRLAPMPVAAGELTASLERWIRLRADLDREKQAHCEVGTTPRRPWFHDSTEVVDALSGRWALTVVPPAGAALDEWMAAAPAALREKIARRACRVWLGAVLDAGWCPLMLDPEALTVGVAGRLALVGGPFVPLGRSARANLRRYLGATAAEDASSATACLADEVPVMTAKKEKELRERVRYVAPFRDGGWMRGGDRLAQTLLAHRRHLGDLGLRPSRGFEALYSALIGIADSARRVAPGEDSLLEGWQEYRLRRLVESAGGLDERRAARDLVERQLPALLELPTRLDRLLDRSAAAADDKRSPRRARQPGGSGRAAPLAVLLMAVGAVAVVGGRFAETPGVEVPAALLMLALGLLFLWTARR